MKHPARRPDAFLVGPFAIFAFGAFLASFAFAAAPPAVAKTATATPVAGSQGLDTSLPLTGSAVTVHGRAPFDTLSITVNQTQKLTNQAVSITWTGGTETTHERGTFTSNFLQIMQCWGDDDGTHPENPGPPPEQCEQGAAYADPTGPPNTLFGDQTTITRIISNKTWANFDPNVGVSFPGDNLVWLPYRAVDGTVVDIQTDPTFDPNKGSSFWANPFFNSITTNEVAGAVTGPDGTGAELFQTVTANESSGLGCGRKVQPVAGGGFVAPKCWIVVVPRGSQALENVGSPSLAFGGLAPVATSPVSPAAWAHRIAIPIDFKPLDASCAFSDVERRMAGSQLVIPAVSSWQPLLCGAGGLPPFDFAPVGDGAARSLLTTGTAGGPGMVVVSRPIAPDAVPPDKPVVYAPISVSGLVIGFNVERVPSLTAPSEVPFAGVRVAQLNLTPRLVAKLLTQSYGAAVSIVAPPNYPWLKTNPEDMNLDPDFLQFNPEFNLLHVSSGKTFSSLQLPAGNSDAAHQLWEWIFADPEASAFLGGQADPWGMTVNPVYNTSATANPTGIAFGDPLPDSFPKADPYCYQAPAQGPGGSIIPPPLCGTDWMPYRSDFVTTAQVTRSAADAAKTIRNPLAENTSQVWKTALPQLIGNRAMLAVTDTPSAVQFGLQVASLSRAGDDADTRTFVAPDSNGLTAGVGSMNAKSVSTVLEPNPSATAAGAYPLTAISYAAISPLSLDASARSDFAKFLDYAAGPGQVPGLELGQLPKGYAPLTGALRSQVITAAQQVRTMLPPPTTTTTAQAAPPDTRSTSPRFVPPPETPVTEPSTVAPSSTAVVTTTTPDATPSTTTTTIAAVITQPVPVSGIRFAVPGLGLMAMGSALGALEISKRPRRGPPGGAVPTDADEMNERGTLNEEHE